MLELFAAHDVRATWATVGMVFCATRDELIAAAPARRPAYTDARLSSYSDLDAVGEDEAADPYHFGASLVRRIADAPGQELASHTFSHYFCLEPGQGPADFAADLDAAIAVADRVGVSLRSIVFPRNEVNEAYLPLCRERGFTAFRGPQTGWMHTSRAGSRETALRRSARLADAHLPLLRRTSYPGPAANAAGLADIPASRFLRPRSARLEPVRELILRRIESEMTRAAQAGETYHLWWHPHNFGVDQDAHLADLARLLEHFSALRASHRMDAPSMSELAAA
jgi:peptidoglycan/xylan/chitin deacetylase (PgdA/CDA1 family)